MSCCLVLDHYSEASLPGVDFSDGVFLNSLGSVSFVTEGSSMFVNSNSLVEDITDYLNLGCQIRVNLRNKGLYEKAVQNLNIFKGAVFSIYISCSENSDMYIWDLIVRVLEFTDEVALFLIEDVK